MTDRKPYENYKMTECKAQKTITQLTVMWLSNQDEDHLKQA